jgi:hypothetical protein
MRNAVKGLPEPEVVTRSGRWADWLGFIRLNLRAPKVLFLFHPYFIRISSVA